MKKGLFIVAMLMVFICGCATITKANEKELIVLSKDNHEMTDIGEKMFGNDCEKFPYCPISTVPVVSSFAKKSIPEDTKMIVLDGGASCDIIYTENGIISSEPACFSGGSCEILLTHPCDFDGGECDIIYSNGGIISATPAMVIDGTEVVYSNGGYIPVEAATRK